MPPIYTLSLGVPADISIILISPPVPPNPPSQIMLCCLRATLCRMGTETHRFSIHMCYEEKINV